MQYRLFTSKILVICSVLALNTMVYAEGNSATKISQLKVSLPAIANGAPIPGEYAFCIKDGAGKGKFGPNQSPEIKWEGAPEGTKSFALLVVDPKVPSIPDQVNQEGKTVPKDLPRINFYHWVLANIPANINHLAMGVEGKGVVKNGKKAGQTKHGVRGLNNYGDWFATDPNMEGQYGGYDGPCPPWNDEVVHEYHFEVYALDVEFLKLKDIFKATDVLKAMKGHVLAKGKSVGHYTLNPKVQYGK